MRDRGLFAVVLALVAGVFFWPGASRQGDQVQSVRPVPVAAPAKTPAAARAGVAITARAGARGGSASPPARAQSAKAAGKPPEALPPEAGRHGGTHPHVSGAMLLLLADFLALDPHPEAFRQAAMAHVAAHGDGEHPAAAGPAVAGQDSDAELSDAQAERLSQEIGEAAAKGGITIEPLIATLPDPIESHAKWMFDRSLDGLSRAITASGYVMDRFGSESWWSSTNPHASVEHASVEETTAAASDGGAPTHPIHHHEGEPGVVLYPSVEGKQVLVLLIVTETATEGVHSHAMLTALDSAANLIELQPRRDSGGGLARSGSGADACCTPGLDRTLKLVGPTFSGSAVSLRASIDRWLTVRTDGCWGLRIVSGSMSNGTSWDTLVWDKRVTFQATVPTEDALQRALFTYLQTLNGGRREPIAWIVEDNTAFGATFNQSAAELTRSSTRRASTAAAARSLDAISANCRVDPPETAAGSHSASDAAFERITIPFPMHLSRLYGAAADERAQTQTPGKNLFTPQNIIPLHLADSGSPRDALPPMTPELTFASVEMALAALLDSIHSERIRLVAIMATDTRDTLFLADQLARRAPDALLFTTATDILYLHPDVNNSVRGMLIASAYPLNPVAQSWTPHDEERVLQLQHNSAQGIYNATVALLGGIGTNVPSSDHVPPLLDYGAPGPGTQGGTTGPAIWISSVGRDALWPVAIFDTRDKRFNDARLLEARTNPGTGQASPNGVSRDSLPDLLLSPWATALFVALALLAMLHIGVYALAGPRGRERRRRDPTRVLSGPASLHWLTRSFRPSSESAADAQAASSATRAAATPGTAVATTAGATATGAAPTANTAAAAAPGQDATTQTDPPIIWNDSNASNRRAPVTVYQLVCILALWTFFTVPVTLSLIWLRATLGMPASGPQTATTTIVIAWSAALVALAGWIGLTVLAGALAWTTIRRIGPRWRTLWREARGWPTTVRLLLWMIGLAAIVQTATDVLRHMPFTEAGVWAELPYFMRSTTLANGVSPVVTYFLVTATFYAWGLMNLRRLATPTPLLCISLPESVRQRDWRLPLLRGLGFPDPEGVIEGFQRRSTDVFFAVPPSGPLVALASVVVIYVIVLGPTPLTIEGPWFGTAIVLSMIILHVITGLAVFQFYLLWRSLRAFLEQLTQDGLLDAFESLGKRHVRVISAGISLRGPRDIDVYLAEHSPMIEHALAPATNTALVPATSTALVPATSTALVPETSTALVPESNKALAPATNTALLPAASDATTPVTIRSGAELSGERGKRSGEGGDLSNEGVPLVVLDFLTQRAAARDAQRDDVTIATLVAFSIQQILTRLGELLAYATTATALVIIAFATYPFTRGPVLDGFGWLYVFILAGTALIVFIQVARDPILGRLKGYEKPGSFNWDRELITKVALYAGVPLFGFISSQFPWLGRLLGQWLQPVQQALPWQ